MLNDPVIAFLAPFPPEEMSGDLAAASLSVICEPQDLALPDAMGQLEQVQINSDDTTLVLKDILGPILVNQDVHSVASYEEAYQRFYGNDYLSAAHGFLQLICQGLDIAAALQGLAASLLRMDKYESAAQVARFLSAVLPKHPRPAAVLGYALHNMREYKQSRLVLSRLAHMSRRNTDFHPYLRFAQRILLQQQFRSDLQKEK